MCYWSIFINICFTTYSVLTTYLLWPWIPGRDRIFSLERLLLIIPASNFYLLSLSYPLVFWRALLIRTFGMAWESQVNWWISLYLTCQFFTLCCYRARSKHNVSSVNTSRFLAMIQIYMFHWLVSGFIWKDCCNGECSGVFDC